MRRRGAQRVAWLVVISLLTFIVGPVCGGATDVDAKSCCARHSHSDTDCAGATSHPHQAPEPEQCCQFGHLLYPIAKPESSLAGQVAVSLDASSMSLVALPAADALPPYITAWFTPVEVHRSPGVPLYDLTTTYRI